MVCGLKQKGCSATVTLGPIPEAPGDGDKQHLQTLVDSIIEEDRNIISFALSRQLADKRYGESYLDEFGIPASVET